jgi:CO/xanthine dehydrogenase Mo-binding subunit
MSTYSVVGQRTKRLDAPQKLNGQERFTGDLRFPGQLYARPVTSPYAHARIVGIEKSAALAQPGVVAVLAAGDLPLAKDENGNAATVPIATDEVLFAGQIVALVLAENDAAAQDAAALVEVDYEPLDAVISLDRALDSDSPRVRLTELVISDEESGMHNADAAQETETVTEQLPPNVSNSMHFSRGDVNQGFAEADEIVDLTFDSETVHQGYIETQAALVTVDPLGGIDVYTSTQAAFHCRNRVAETLGIPHHKINVEPMPVGGGFGGKFVLIEPLVAAAAVAVQKPVLLQYTRIEDFSAANPAPSCRIQLKVGAKKDGTLSALESHVIFNAGSAAWSPMEIASILMGGYYRVPNLEITGYEVLTNTVTMGAYRAPGAQQGTFAIESVMDELGRRLELDPLEFRLKNCVVEGDSRPNGSDWPRIGLKETLEAIQQHPIWQNRDQSRAQGRGVGLAVGGWPGGLQPASAACRLDEDGTLTVVLGSVDLNGTNTTFAQILAEELNVGFDSVHVTTTSTDAAPYAGGTGGSKITYTVGPAVQKAAAEAKQQILEIAAQHLEASVEDLELRDGVVQVKGVPTSAVSLKEIATMSTVFGGKYQPVYGYGATAIVDSAPGFAVHVAEVEVDDVTGQTKVVNYVAGQDVGFAINPAAIEGQVHGGVAQGIGWALYEGLQYDDDGQLLTASLMDYTLPKADMIPPIDVVLVEVPSEHGAYGSKGVGEPPAIPGPAAVANAIRDASGARVTQIPIRPEVLSKAIASNGAD